MSKKKSHGTRRPTEQHRNMAALYAAAQPTGVADPRTLGGSMSGPGGPRDRGAVVLDMTDVVLLDGAEVCTIDNVVRNAVFGGQAIFMTLAGRVNKTTRRVQVGYIFGPDGAAALITQLLALADRHGAELLDDVTRRLTELHQEKAVDLHFLRAAIDNAIEGAE